MESRGAMGQCLSNPDDDLYAVPDFVVRDRRCEEDFAFDVGTDKIGEGVQGVVFAARDRATGESVAVKRTTTLPRRNGGYRSPPFSEMLLLSRCDHPNVVRLRAAYHDKRTGDVHVVLDRVTGRTLVEYLIELRKEQKAGRPREDILTEKKSILRQLVDAVAHLHSRDIVYRDLKPANVVVTRDPSPRAVLVDFGRAARLRRSERLNELPPLGTSLFQAPEVEERAEYGQQSDMWAVGVLIYLVVGWRMPFEHSLEGLHCVLAGDYHPFDAQFCDDARNIIRDLLVVDPNRRMNAAQCLQHGFFASSGVSAAERILSQIHARRRNRPTPEWAERESASTAAASIDADADGELSALEIHEMVARRTCELLARRLRKERLTTVRRWLAMSAEELPRVNLGPPSRLGRRRDDPESVRARDARRSHENENEGESPERDAERRRSLERLYAEMRAVGEGSVARASAAAAAAPAGDVARGRANLLGVAHARGLCSLDELIAACRSSGESALAEELEVVKREVRDERVGWLVRAGVKTTGASNPVLDTVLFRREELLERAAKCEAEEWGEVIDARDVDVAAGAA